MAKKTVAVTLCSFVLMVAIPATSIDLRVAAQNKKPSKALREFGEKQRELSEKFEREVTEGKALPYEWEVRAEGLRRVAAELAAEFKISDWKGEELLSLAALYQLSEQFTPAIEAFRAYQQNNPRQGSVNFVGGVDVRASLVRALLELDRVEEANNVFDELYKSPLEEPRFLASKIALKKELAIALRDRGYMEKAAERARAGYEMTELGLRSGVYRSSLTETTRQDQFILAAIYVSIKEKLGRKKDAEDFNKIVMRYDFKQEPTMRSFYETELSIARLIGNPAPELFVAQWLDGKSRSLSELRGKVVLLDFWAMWCSPCVAAFPRFREFQSKYGSSGFEIIGVTKFYGRSDKEDDLSREGELKSLEDYKRRYQLNYSLAISKMDDVTNEERFSVFSLPTVILIDRRGNVRQVKRGIGEYSKLGRMIGKLINEKQT